MLDAQKVRVSEKRAMIFLALMLILGVVANFYVVTNLPVLPAFQ